MKLLLLRVLALIGCSLPAMMAASEGIAGKIGHKPYFLDQDPPGSPVRGEVFDLEPSFIGIAVAGVLLFLLIDQLLTATALLQLDPSRPVHTPVKIWRTMWTRAWSHFWPLMRVVALSALLAGIGLGVLNKVFGAVSESAATNGWVGMTRVVWLPLIRAVITALWLSLVGAFGHWCKVLIIADSRRRVRRVALHAVKVLWRSPLRTFGFYIALTLFVQLAGGSWLAATAPLGGGPNPVLVFLAYLFVQAYAWYWLVHAARLHYAETQFDGVRVGSDEPFGVVRWVQQRLPAAGTPSP